MARCTDHEWVPETSCDGELSEVVDWHSPGRLAQIDDLTCVFGEQDMILSRNSEPNSLTKQEGRFFVMPSQLCAM